MLFKSTGYFWWKRSSQCEFPTLYLARTLSSVSVWVLKPRGLRGLTWLLSLLPSPSGSQHHSGSDSFGFPFLPFLALEHFLFLIMSLVSHWKDYVLHVHFVFLQKRFLCILIYHIPIAGVLIIIWYLVCSVLVCLV